MLIKLQKYLKEVFPNKNIEYRSSDNHMTIYVNGELKYTDYFLNNAMKKAEFDLTDIEIHYPEIIVKDDKKYNVKEDYPNKDEIEFFTIHIKNFTLN